MQVTELNEHPTQALLDAFSIREKLGTLEGKKVAIIGDIMLPGLP
jgi:aspartate carbamoyltransferase catalytic subunit